MLGSLYRRGPYRLSPLGLAHAALLNFAGFVAVGFEHALSRSMSENQAPETAPKFDEGRGALVCATGEELGKMKVKVKIRMRLKKKM